jgi:hypothetical protein
VSASLTLWDAHTNAAVLLWEANSKDAQDGCLFLPWTRYFDVFSTPKKSERFLDSSATYR